MFFEAVISKVNDSRSVVPNLPTDLPICKSVSSDFKALRIAMDESPKQCPTLFLLGRWPLCCPVVGLELPQRTLLFLVLLTAILYILTKEKM